MFSGLTQKLSHGVEVAVTRGAEVACSSEEYGYTKTQVPVREHRETSPANRPVAAPTLPSTSVETVVPSPDKARDSESKGTSTATSENEEEIK